jgi:hypothetical protein
MNNKRLQIIKGIMKSAQKAKKSTFLTLFYIFNRRKYDKHRVIKCSHGKCKEIEDMSIVQMQCNFLFTT